MSMYRSRVRVWTAVGAALMAAGPAPGQLSPANPLEQAKAMRAVADQKAEATIREVIAEAEKLPQATAVQRLKRAVVSLDLSPEISNTKRNELVSLLQSKVAALEGRPPTPPADPKIAQKKADAQKLLEAYLQESKDIKTGVAEIEKAYAANKPEVANRKIAELAAKYPNNPAVIALMSKGYYGDRAADAKKIAIEQDKRTIVALNSVQRSALPAAADLEFPPDWKEIVERRNNDGIKIGPEEQAILESLEKRVGNGIKDGPFLETVQTISNLIGKEIYLDRKSLEDAGLDLQRPVSMPGNVSARTALRAVLQAQGLTFVIKDKLIQVVTLEKAQTLQVTRAYYLGSLVQGTGVVFPGGSVPGIDFQQTQQMAQMIIDSITQSTDPMVWKEKGGPATIIFHYPSMSLIVRAPAEVHASFRGKLAGR